MKHIVIITGGYLNIEFARVYLKTLSYDKVFAVDKGLEYTDALEIVPDYLIGDFDTVNPDLLASYEERIQNMELQLPVERHPVMKDATDTELAVDVALRQNADIITILAGTGSRMDHMLANLGLLIKIAEHQVKAYIVDENNRISILSTGKETVTCRIRKDEQHGAYISLLPLSAKVQGVTVKGARYPLENATIYPGNSLTVSNEIIDDSIEITITCGKVLIVESKDGANL